MRTPDVRDTSSSRAPYASQVRSGQARATRRTIVAAAAELFAAQGYAATTVDAIADRAGVGRKTVFSSVGGKGALLKLAWDWALAGDDEPVPMSERPAVRAMLEERSPRRLIAMWSDMVIDVGIRAMPLASVVLVAADVDSEVRALRDTIRRESLTGAHAFVRHLDVTGGLRADMSTERAAEACWALINSLLQQLLLTERGWSTGEYREWFERLVSATLLAPETVPSPAVRSVSVRHVPGDGRYEALVGDRVVGRLSYDTGRHTVTLLDVAVDEGNESAAEALVRRAFDDVSAAGTHRILPVSPYAAWWVARRPERAAMVLDHRP